MFFCAYACVPINAVLKQLPAPGIKIMAIGTFAMTLLAPNVGIRGEALVGCGQGVDVSDQGDA